MKKIAHYPLALAILLGLLVGCQKENSAPMPTPKLAQGEFNYVDLVYPSVPFGNEPDPNFFTNLVNPDNPLTNEGATLGRVLFYDGHLSKNNLIACGSCHVQSKGFADPERFSRGFKLGSTTRNSMALSNLSMLRSYFWDSRANKLEEQVMMPIQNHIEMGIEKLELLPNKLSHVPYYPALFGAAFGDTEITEERIRFALAQFLRSMVSGNSRYDQGLADAFADFNPLEKMGKDLFTGWNSRAGCVNCHNRRLFEGWGPENIGLDVVSEDEGAGFGRFKVPSLRNIAVTAPYMHDGRFNTLEEVIDHYDHGVQPHPWLSWALRDYNGPKRLDLTELEKKALVAFLETLTDEQYLTDPKFSDPFK